jgi:ATPase subunit of ABC transporter with duplicated ATPase domains
LLQHQDELIAIALKLKALEKEKANLNAQLATNQRATHRAKKLAETKRKLAAMQDEVEKLQKACKNTEAPHSQPPSIFLQKPPAKPKLMTFATRTIYTKTKLTIYTHSILHLTQPPRFQWRFSTHLGQSATNQPSSPNTTGQSTQSSSSLPTRPQSPPLAEMTQSWQNPSSWNAKVQ